MRLKNERQLENGDYLYDTEFTHEEFDFLKNHVCELVKKGKIPENLLNKLINEAFLDILKDFIKKEKGKIK